MKNKTKIIIVFILVFVMPPIMWLFEIRFTNIVNNQELLKIMMTPSLFIYVTFYIFVMVYLLFNYLNKFERTKKEGEKNRILKRTVYFFIVGTIIYCVIGPLTGFIGHSFLDKTEFFIGWFLGIPLILLYAMPFFSYFLKYLERYSFEKNINLTELMLKLKIRFIIIIGISILGLIVMTTLTTVGLVYKTPDHKIILIKLIIFGVINLISAFVAIFPFLIGLSTRINDSISTIVDIADSIKQKQGDLNKRIEYSTRDEIGMLGNSFNYLMTIIKNVISEVKSSTATVSSAATQLSSTAEELSSTIEEQSSQASLVASAMEELSSTIENNKLMTDESQENVRVMEDVVNQTSDTISEIIDSIKDIGEKSERLSGLISDFEGSAEGIGEILNVITDIADQTNLLALNAAIEAARAGEVGRGFAVVADEIRKLAERTSKSIKEIESITKSIQVGAKEAVRAMDVSLEGVIKGQELAVRGQEMLERVIESSGKVKEITMAVSSAMEEQSTTVMDVNINVQQTVQAIEQSSQAIMQIAQTSGELSTQSESLMELVSRFKTE